MKSPLSSASTPACICARSASSLRASSRLRCCSARSASRTASLAFWYSPASTTSAMNASCSAVRLIFRVGISASHRQESDIIIFGNLCQQGSAAAVLAIELDGFGALLKTEDDAQIAGRPAAERNGFLDMVADRGSPGVFRDRDTDRKLPLAEDRLIGPRHRDKIAEVRGASLSGRGAALADDDDIELEPQRIAGPLAARIDLAQHAVERNPRGLTWLAGPEHRGLPERAQNDRARAGRDRPFFRF